VTLEDVDRAIDIINSELAKNQELYQMVGTDSWERALQSVWRYIQKHRRVSRTQLHRRFSQQIKSTKVMDETERTLVDRGLIRVIGVDVIGSNGRKYTRKDYISRVKPSRPEKGKARKKDCPPPDFSPGRRSILFISSFQSHEQGGSHPP